MMMDKSSLTSRLTSRREALKFLGLSVGAVVAGGAATRAQTVGNSESKPVLRKRVLRIAHLTDIHVQPERDAANGLIAVLKHVHAQPDKVDLILNTGDSIMDSMSQTDARTQLQWDLWHKICNEHCTIPMRSALGNHDIWGWTKSKSKTTGEEPKWGKERGLEALGLKRAYYSFDQNGWHFVVLDSVMPYRDKYKAHLGKRQLEWLENDLAKVDPKTPVLVMSHIPILSVTPLLAPDVSATGDFEFGGGAIHLDGQAIKNIFKKYPNVKVAISGHQHLVDRVDYMGVSYLCNGAVSGGWWKGKNLEECDAGYGLIDLYEDGSFENQYITYGWEYKPNA